MIYRLQRWIIWLRRCGCSRGFGVQSPSAYAFIRYVINEHYPYYAYQELQERLFWFDKRGHQTGRLLLRLANFWQPEICMVNEHRFDAYLHAGCLKAMQEEMDEQLLAAAKGRKRMVVIDLKKMRMEEVRTQVLLLCDDQTMLVLLGNLYREKRGEEWLHLQESEHSGITYDLYDIGIIFFDKKVYKQHQPAHWLSRRQFGKICRLSPIGNTHLLSARRAARRKFCLLAKRFL